MRPWRNVSVGGGLAAVVALFWIRPTGATSTPVAVRLQQPTFRATTTLVPVDVRVVNDHGEAVLGLRQSDFSVTEDGAPQVIKFFEAHSFTATTAGDHSGSASAGTDPIAPANRRVFLIVLGRGRLEVVSHGLTAAAAFVRQLLPQDLVGVMAWDRATIFTTNHAGVAAFLTDLGHRQDAIEARLDDWSSGLVALYGAKEVPSSIQADIDALFAKSALGTPGLIVPVAEGNADERSAAQALLEHDRMANSLNPAQQDAVKTDVLTAVGATTDGLPFDAYVAQMTKADEDLSRLYAGIEFLGHVPGEKHLVFVTATGLPYGSMPTEKEPANRAANARVALHIVQTGGTAGIDPFEPMDRAIYDPYPQFSVATLEKLEDATGGTGSIYSEARKGFDAIDRATSSEYVIGYESTHPAVDGAFRKIAVHVRQPGVTVMARSGYFATPALALSEREIKAYSRILSAAGSQRHDFKLSATATDVAMGSEWAVDVHITVDPTNLHFEATDSGRMASLNVALFSRTDTSAPGSWHVVTLRTPEGASGSHTLTFTIRAETGAKPHRVQVVVYEYRGDVVSTAFAR